MSIFPDKVEMCRQAIIAAGKEAEFVEEYGMGIHEYLLDYQYVGTPMYVQVLERLGLGVPWPILQE